MNTNRANKTDSFLAIKYQKWFMILTAMWPLDNATFKYKLWNYFILACVAIITLILFVEISVQINNMEVFNDMLTIMMSVLCYVVKHSIYQTKIKSFRKIINYLKEDIFFEYPDDLDYIMRDEAMMVSRINMVYQTFCYAAMFILVTKPFIMMQQTHEFKPMYEITFLHLTNQHQYYLHAFETFSFLCAVGNNSCLDTVSGGLITIAATHFTILNRKIKDCKKYVELKEPESKNINKSVNAWLKQCVQHHTAILTLVEYIEDTFNIGYLIQCLASVIVICNIGFQLVHTTIMLQFIAMFIYLGAMLTQLALYCWFGNELMLKSEYLRDSCYLSEWVEFDDSVRKTLLIIMERSKRPVYLTAGKFANLSLDSYKSILKSAYSYFALMQTLYSKNEETDLLLE